MFTKCIIALTAFTLLCFNVSAQSLPSEKEQYNFLRWYVKNVETIGLSDSTVQFGNEFESSKALKHIFKKSRVLSHLDIQYLIRQLSVVKGTIKLDAMKLTGVVWNLAGDTTSNPIGTYLSLPIFNRNRNKVFIYHAVYCGRDCGQEGIKMYVKNRNGVWRQAFDPKFTIIMY